MREISINYSNTENLINNLLNILNNLDIEKSNVKKALNELYDLENYYSNKGGIISELEYRERKIDNDIRNTEELIHNLKSFSKSVQETDERLAQKFKQDIKSYAKQNNIELVSELDNFLKKAQMALDGIGLIPGIGEIADGINGVISLLQGNWGDAAISFMAIIPFAGDSLKALKYTDEASELLKLGDKVVDLKKGGKVDIRAYRGLEDSSVLGKYEADSRLVVDMPYIGKGSPKANSEGWLRDSNYYWSEVLERHPGAFSSVNKNIIEGKHPTLSTPVNDATFRKYFKQYDEKGLRGTQLIHHHIGGGGQAVGIPKPLHPGFGGVHNAEKRIGIWGADSQYAELLQKFIKKR